MDVPEVARPRLAGYAIYTRGGYIMQVPSCLRCAKVMGVPWREALFEGECRGCEVPLSGNVG